jgi:hypothetical protein
LSRDVSQQAISDECGMRSGLILQRLWEGRVGCKVGAHVVHDCAIPTLGRAILLWCVGYCPFMSDAIATYVEFEFAADVLSAIVC